jgi:hypothetical protein
MELDGLLRAHAFMKVERPPELWHVETEDDRFLPMLGEMIVVGLGAGSDLSELTLAVSNVVVDPDDDPHEQPSLDPGEYVAITVRGPGAWGDDVWHPAEGPTQGLLTNLAPRADDAGAVLAYARDLGAGGGAVTVVLPRSVPV